MCCFYRMCADGGNGDKLKFSRRTRVPGTSVEFVLVMWNSAPAVIPLQDMFAFTVPQFTRSSPEMPRKMALRGVKTLCVSPSFGIIERGIHDNMAPVSTCLPSQTPYI